MKPSNHWEKYFTGILGFWLCLAMQVDAQQGPGGIPGGGFGGGAQNRRSGSSTRTYPSAGTVGDAVISIDPETRRVIVITDQETSEYVSQVITNLDRPKPQVLIKVVFVEVTYNNSSDIGVEGGFRRGIAGGTVGNAANVFGLSGLNSVATNLSFNALGQPVQSFVPMPPGAGLYQVLGQDYQATLRAIAQAGKLEVLSRPSILARNNQPATITVGKSVPLITNVRYDNFGNAINSVTYTSVGIILRVTPFITSDGMVEMIVSPEISSLAGPDESIPISTGASAPVINVRSADTVVVTPDAQPVIIGGLMQNSKSDAQSKIPILGDIPLLGAAFRHKAKATTKTELLIFLTPHIVMAPTQLAAVSAKERGNAQLAPKAFSEQELNRFLDTLPAKDSALPDDKAPDQNVPNSNKTRK